MFLRAARYIFQTCPARLLILMDVSISPSHPDKAIVYLDGIDARVYKQLLEQLESEERVQNAIILLALLSQAKKDNRAGSSVVKRVKSKCFELLGISFEEFLRISMTF